MIEIDHISSSEMMSSIAVLKKNYAYEDLRTGNVLPKNLKSFTIQFMRKLHLKLQRIASYAELSVLYGQASSEPATLRRFFESAV